MASILSQPQCDNFPGLTARQLDQKTRLIACIMNWHDRVILDAYKPAGDQIILIVDVTGGSVSSPIHIYIMKFTVTCPEIKHETRY